MLLVPIIYLLSVHKTQLKGYKALQLLIYCIQFEIIFKATGTYD